MFTANVPTKLACAVAFSLTMALALAPRLVSAEVTQDPPEKVMKMMVEAIKAKSQKDFLAEANDTMKASLTKEMFEGVSNQMAPRLRGGYKTAFLTRLHRQDAAVFLWKLTFTDGKDEFVVTMAVQAKKVAGFFVQ